MNDNNFDKQVRRLEKQTWYLHLFMVFWLSVVGGILVYLNSKNFIPLIWYNAVIFMFIVSEYYLKRQRRSARRIFRNWAKTIDTLESPMDFCNQHHIERRRRKK